MSSRAKPFSFEYVGVHPAGRWLMGALQRHHHAVEVNAVPRNALAEVAPHMENVPYLVNDLPWRQLGEPVVYWPFEWQEQRMQACVTASLQDQSLLIHQSQPLQLMQLDYPCMISSITRAFSDGLGRHATFALALVLASIARRTFAKGLYFLRSSGARFNALGSDAAS